MCLLIISPKGDFPSDEVLNLGFQQNQHGGGIAYLGKEGNKKVVRWKKDLSLEQIKAFRSKVKGPHIIHFRLVSIGGKLPKLCHPFGIDAEASCDLEGFSDMALAHNGTWSNYSKELMSILDDKIVLPAGPWSDTRAMAFLAHTKGINFLSSIDEKVAVLKSDGEVTIFAKHKFHEHEGLFLSYDPFKRTTKTNTTKSTSPAINNNKPIGEYSGYNDWAERDKGVSVSTNTSSFKTSNIVEKAMFPHYNGFKIFTGVELPAITSDAE